MISREGARDRSSIATAAILLVVTIAAWAQVLGQALFPADTAAMDTSAGMSAPDVLTLAGLVGFVVAWTVMMVAMMIPSASPMILLFRRVARGQPGQHEAVGRVWLFTLGYLALWGALGIPVYVASQLLGAVLGGDGALSHWAPFAVALVLVAAGLYQFTGLKAVCLRACQSPLAFLMGHWRPGAAGAFQMGLHHALYCTGCCWALMVVLVAAGAMGLTWVLLIALIIAAEKLLRGFWATRVAGVALVGLGALTLLEPGLAPALRGPGM